MSYNDPLSSADLNTRIETLLRANDFGRAEWFNIDGPRQTLTYWFEDGPTVDSERYEVGGTFSPFDAGARAQVDAALAQFEDVLNIRFELRNPALGDPDISFHRASDLYLDNPNFDGTGGIGAWRYRFSDWDGSVFFSDTRDLSDPDSRYLIIHEIGHALGLKHPGDYDVSGAGPGGPFLPDAEDNTRYTMMSYFEDPDSGEFTDVLRLYDIAALQRWWGESRDTALGNTTYSIGAASPAQVIWDAGGVDTLVADAAAATLDLRAGVFAEVGGNTQTVIGYGTVIENATGAGGSDTLTGNDTDNRLQGMGGDDALMGGLGSDTLDGGAGTDTVSFIDYGAAVIVNLMEGTANSGTDRNVLIDVENITGSIYGDFILTDEAVNRVRSGGGYDWMVGSEGADYFDGSNGRDMISYINGAQAVEVDLGAGRGRAGQANGDRYVEIERVTGTIYSDLFYGSDGEDEFRGAGGYDWMVASTGGRDRYDGGVGLDTVAYTAATSGVSASLLLGRGVSGDAARDLYTSIESLTGSNHDDTLTGDNGRNILRGMYGEDTLFGNGGNDRLYGGALDDVLAGGAGYDVALFDGRAADYTVQTSGPVGGQTTTVTHLNAGRDGTDTLTGIEALQFADELVFL